MSGEDISRALGDIPEAQLASAMEVYGRKRSDRHIILRAAACAAVVALLLTALLWPVGGEGENSEIIAMPGIVKVYACELDGADPLQLAEYALIEGDDFPYVPVWGPFFGWTGALNGIPFAFLIEEEDLEGHTITFEISTNCGELHSSAKQDYALLGKETQIHNGDTVHWRGYEVYKEHGGTDETWEQTLERLGGVYVDIIIKADGNIIGFAIFELLCTTPDAGVFSPQMCASVYYPKVDGEFQAVTDEYVSQQMTALKID